VDATVFSAVGLALPAVAVMGDTGKFPVVASTLASAADLMVDVVAFSTVALAIPTAAVMGDPAKIPSISPVASAIPAAVFGGDAVKISTVASAKYVEADTSAIPAVASAITTVDCGRELGSDCDPMMTLWLEMVGM
jgi:hypothetical protein